MVTTAVAATTDGVASAYLGDFAVAVAAVKLDDVAGRCRRTAVEARAVGGAVGACGVFGVGCGRVPCAVGAGASWGVERQWLRQYSWWASL